MNHGPGWERRALHALVLLLALAYGIRWAFDLVQPVIPFLIAGVVVASLASVILMIRQRRRW